MPFECVRAKKYNIKLLVIVKCFRAKSLNRKRYVYNKANVKYKK